MKQTIILILGLTIAILTSCSNNKDYKIPDSITTTKTDSHSNIPGTKVLLIIPDGFEFSKSLPRIENKSNSYIQVMDLVGANYFLDSEKLIGNFIKKRNANILLEKDVMINNYSGKINVLETVDTENHKTHTIALAFGNSNFYTMIAGESKINDTVNYNLIINSLRSIYYDETKVIFPSDNANFTLDDTDSKLKFAGFTGGVFAYNIGGLDKAYYYPLMTVMQFPVISRFDIKSSADNIIMNLSNAGIRGIKLINSEEGETNGHSSFIGEYSGIWNGKDALIYLHCVLLEKSFIVMQGVSDNDLEGSLIEFKKLSNTIKDK
jgi:hypothetical protein